MAISGPSNGHERMVQPITPATLRSELPDNPKSEEQPTDADIALIAELERLELLQGHSARNQFFNTPEAVLIGLEAKNLDPELRRRVGHLIEVYRMTHDTRKKSGRLFATSKEETPPAGQNIDTMA